jgi:hypothetical protein
MVNDFLASISTLYDGVRADERGSVLRGLELDEDDDGFDSDECPSIYEPSAYRQGR